MKKFISITLAAAIACAAVPAALAETKKFSDVQESHWAYKYINNMAEDGIIDGYDDGTFNPDGIVSRAELAKMMVIADGIKNDTTEGTFSDVASDAWYAAYVRNASEYIMGYSNDDGTHSFEPNQGATRFQIARAIVKRKGYDLTKVDTEALEKKFSDVAGLDIEKKLYIAAAYENGIMDGYDEGVFKPDDVISRAQAAAILDRAFGKGDVVITVGNKKIRSEELKTEAQGYAQYYGATYEQALTETANILAELLIIEQVAPSLGIELNDQQKFDLSSRKAEIGENSIYNDLFAGQYYQQNLSDKYASEFIEPTDEEVRDYFDNNYYHAKHILIADKETADKIKDMLKNGDNFDDLMKEYSTDPGSTSNPNGYVFTIGEMVKPFEECVTNTEIDGIGECQSNYGWHVIERLALTDDDFASVEASIMNKFKNDYVTKCITDDLTSAGITADINLNLMK